MMKDHVKFVEDEVKRENRKEQVKIVREESKKEVQKDEQRKFMRDHFMGLEVEDVTDEKRTMKKL